MSASRWSVTALGKAHPRIALDANVLIYVLDGMLPEGIVGRALINAIEEGRIQAVISAVGQIEVLAGPARARDARVFEAAADELRSFGLRFVAIDSSVAEDAAWLRGAESLTLGDAIHVASARAAGATAFVTNDRRIRSIASLEVIYLDDFDAA